MSNNSLLLETEKTSELSSVFRDALKHFLEISEVVHLSKKGIHQIYKSPPLIKALKELGDFEGNRSLTGQDVDIANQEAEMAEREIKNDFPLIHNQASITLWSLLETTIENTMATLFHIYPHFKRTDIVGKLRISLSEYESLNESERGFYIVALLEQELKTSQKLGVNRFEALLDIFKLSGEIDEVTSKSIFELQQVRNVLVHKRGLADKRLIDGCPWLKLQLYDKIRVNSEM